MSGLIEPLFLLLRPNCHQGLTIAIARLILTRKIVILLRWVVLLKYQPLVSLVWNQLRIASQNNKHNSIVITFNTVGCSLAGRCLSLLTLCFSCFELSAHQDVTIAIPILISTSKIVILLRWVTRRCLT